MMIRIYNTNLTEVTMLDIKFPVSIPPKIKPPDITDIASHFYSVVVVVFLLMGLLLFWVTVVAIVNVAPSQVRILLQFLPIKFHIFPINQAWWIASIAKCGVKEAHEVESG